MTSMRPLADYGDEELDAARGSLDGRSAMTGAGSHGYPVDTHGDPLTFAVSGLMADVPGTIRDYVIEGVSVDPGEGIVLAEPVDGSIRLSRTNRGLVVDGEAAHHAGGGVRAVPAAGPDAGPAADRRGGPAVDRPGQRTAGPARGGWRPGGRAPHRSPRAGAAAARRRGDLPAGADRTAVRARLPRPVPRVRRSASRPVTATTTGPSTPVSRRSAPSGSTPGTRAGRLPVRPPVRRRRVCAPRAVGR